MPSLVRANIFQRKTRAAITILAVAVPVTAVLLIVGLSNGTLAEVAERMESVGADIIVQPAGSSRLLGLSSTTLREAVVEVIQQVEGVQAVAPIYFWSAMVSGGAPVNAWGIDPRFEQVGASLTYLDGRGLDWNSSELEMVVDRRFAEANNVSVGDNVEMLGAEWKGVGTAHAGIGARIYVRLSRLRELVGQPTRVHLIFVKADRLDQTGELSARIETGIPGVQTTVLEEYSTMVFESIAGLNIFRGVLAGVAVSLSFLVILLAMYTSIIERTREIGILKALGGSKLYIVLTIMQESMLLSLLGVVGGYGLSRFSAAMLVAAYPTLMIQFSYPWTLAASALGMLGGILGSFYPAILAAGQDPGRALRDE